MKKIFAILLSILMAISITACNSKDKESSQTKAQVQADDSQSQSAVELKSEDLTLLSPKQP